MKTVYLQLLSLQLEKSHQPQSLSKEPHQKIQLNEFRLHGIQSIQKLTRLIKTSPAIFMSE